MKSGKRAVGRDFGPYPESAPSRVRLFEPKVGPALYVERGSKKTSKYDFRVRYWNPATRRLRTPKHIHVVVDLFAKSASKPRATRAFINRILKLIPRLRPAKSFPPVTREDLRTWVGRHSSASHGLRGAGEYSPDFLLALVYLLMLQERTNYPHGTLNVNLFESLRDGSDIFDVVTVATFRGPS